MFKALANYPMDKALEAGMVGLRVPWTDVQTPGMIYPAMTASIYMICSVA